VGALEREKALGLSARKETRTGEGYWGKSKTGI
jgi:hypothetical protein